MTKEEKIDQIDRIISTTKNNPKSGLVQAIEFLKIYIGKDSQFLKYLLDVDFKSPSDSVSIKVHSILNGLKEYIENDLLRNISFEREIQLETVSDYLEQAEKLLNDKKVHPAAATVIIGASLEEFLRNWLEELNFDLNTIKNSLDAYSQELRTLDLISKQDAKDILSWTGTRNDAAHGHWENVEDRQRIKLMLEGVNLFIRQKTFIK